MTRRRIPVPGTLFAMALAALAVSAPAGAQSEAFQHDASYSDGFRIGDSCAALAYSSQKRLRYVTSPEFSEEFYAFCFPEEPFECSDYSSFLQGMGQLSTGDDGFYCQLDTE